MEPAPIRQRLPKLKAASRTRKTRKRKIQRRRKIKRRKILPAFPNKASRQKSGKRRKGANKAKRAFFAPFVIFRMPNHVSSGHRYNTARAAARAPRVKPLTYARITVSMYYNKRP